MKDLRNKEQGFTIIEVMIVLVIAAVILLIVFLAIPALQRNSRNTQLKNDVAAVLAGITEFSNNNDGKGVTTVTTAGNLVTLAGAGGTTPLDVKVQQGNTFTNGTAMPAATSTGTVVIYVDRKCNGNAFAATSTSRAYAAGFNIEGTGAPTPQCKDS
jgi:prepilin-type N-terminal cleavage/methylation domain-containing protein